MTPLVSNEIRTGDRERSRIMTSEDQNDLLIRLDVRTERMEDDIAEIKRSIDSKVDEKQVKSSIDAHIVDCISQKKKKDSIAPAANTGFFASMSAAQKNTFISMVLALGGAITLLIKSYVG